MRTILKKEKIISFLEYIIALSIILEANTIWLNKNNTRIKFNFIILCFSLILSIIIDHRDLIKKKNFKFSYILVTLLIISNIVFTIFNEGYDNKFLAKFVILFSLFIIYSNSRINDSKNKSLLIKMSKIMLVLSVISLIFYFFGTCLNFIKPSSYILLNWGGEYNVPNYYGLHYSAQSTTLNGMIVIRNTGIFTEAPAYSFNLCIALVVEMFIKEKIDIKRIIILIITIFSTISLAGILVVLMLIIIKSISKKNKSMMIHVIKWSVLPIILLLTTSIGLFFIKDKISSSENNKNGSFSIRKDDYEIAVEAWKENVLVGHGYERHDLTKRYMSSIRGRDTGGSNGLIMILPQGGLYLLVFYLLPFILSIIYSINNKKFNETVLSITIFVLFMLSNMSYTYLMIYFLATGWINSIKRQIY